MDTPAGSLSGLRVKSKRRKYVLSLRARRSKALANLVRWTAIGLYWAEAAFKGKSGGGLQTELALEPLELP